MYWHDWLVWRALNKTFLPRAGGFQDQPYLLMQVIMTLDGLFEKILTQNDETAINAVSSEE